MAKMIIMVGLPASGKSTTAKEIIAAEGNTVRINKDLLRTMLHFDKFTGKNEGITKQTARAVAKELLQAGKNVIIDDTNLNPGTVQGWVDLAKECNAKIQYVRMDTSVSECIERDADREKSVGRDVIVKMALQHLEYLKGEKVVICDLDGTLCDITHRLHFVRGSEQKDWKGFFEALKNDKLRTEVLERVLKVCADNNARLIFVSARPHDYYEHTIKWIFDHTISEPFDYDALIMRESGDKRPDTEVKAEIYEKYLKNLKIVKVFDDRPVVIKMWREKGLDVEDVGHGVDF